MTTSTELGKENRTTVVTASSAGLTQFDPILNDPGARPTIVVNAGTKSATANLRRGDTVSATARTPVRREGEEGVALPRRDYRRQFPVVKQA